MNTIILEESQTALNTYERAILGFVNPMIFHNKKEQAKQLDITLGVGKDLFKEKNSWLKEARKNPNYDAYSAFLKRYEKLQYRVQDFIAKFSKTQIIARLHEVKNSLTRSFEAKANLNKIAHQYANRNFLADMHSKSVLVENKFQNGKLSADKAYEHIDKIQNTYNNNPLNATNPTLAKLIGDYKENYASQSIFKKDGGSYDFQNILSAKSVALLAAENEQTNAISAMLFNQKRRLLRLYRKFDIAKLNNLMVDAQKQLALVGEPEFN